MFDPVIEVDVDFTSGNFEECRFVVPEFFELLLYGGHVFDSLRLLGLGGANAVGQHLLMIGVTRGLVAEIP